MELLFILIALGIYVFGIGTGLAIDAMTTRRTRKMPAPLLGVVLPREEKK